MYSDIKRPFIRRNRKPTKTFFKGHLHKKIDLFNWWLDSPIDGYHLFMTKSNTYSVAASNNQLRLSVLSLANARFNPCDEL